MTREEIAEKLYELSQEGFEVARTVIKMKILEEAILSKEDRQKLKKSIEYFENETPKAPALAKNPIA
jgi:predicted HTH transcriptional regulator